MVVNRQILSRLRVLSRLKYRVGYVRLVDADYSYVM